VFEGAAGFDGRLICESMDAFVDSRGANRRGGNSGKTIVRDEAATLNVPVLGARLEITTTYREFGWKSRSTRA
jgi:hypothetical protein